MVQVESFRLVKRSFRVLAILSVPILGAASVCAAGLSICLSSLTVLSSALKVSDHHYAESRFPNAQLLLWGDLRNDTTAGLASVPDVRQQDIQFISFESRFLGAQLLLRRDLRNDTTAGPARVPDVPQQDIQFISFESRFLSAQPLLRRDFRNDTAAGLASVPDVPRQGIQFIRFDALTLPPMAFTQFCLKYAGDCKPQRLLFGGDRLELNKIRWAELESINRTVNSSIHPVRNEDGLAGEKWLLSPVSGDCNDYAVTKRHQLIARGWPARAILLGEVVTVSGEHHLVTVVRTDRGDLVLDNLTDQIMHWSRTPYRWVRIQTPKNPNYWASISERNA
jgi:predicted transglutaminase-like cysteine proteinase